MAPGSSSSEQCTILLSVVLEVPRQDPGNQHIMTPSHLSFARIAVTCQTSPRGAQDLDIMYDGLAEPKWSIDTEFIVCHLSRI